MTQPVPTASGNRDGAPPPRVGICVLGGLQLRLDGRELTGFESDKARALLVFLAWHAGSPVRREVLAALFWGGQPQSLAMQNLRKTLHRLRKTLGAAGDVLISTPQTVEFDARAALDLDAREFSGLLAGCRSHRHRHPAACRPCRERLQRAAELYGGELLHGFTPGDCPEFDEWAGAERERLHVEAVEVLQRLAEAHLTRDDHAQARACARRALALEPWNEAAHRVAMRALAAEGRRAAALAQFQECVRVLERELGAAPERDTLELAERIRRQADALAADPSAGDAPVIAWHLPAPVSSFVGREREMEAIADRLGDPDTRLLTLTGAGGSGKTRLAVEAAREAGRAFADGACFVSLAPLTAPDQIAAAVVQALGLAFSAGVEPRVQLAGHLRALDLLLVLDNFEHVTEGSALVGDLLRSCPRLVVLTTSRERLNVPGERVFAVAPLAAEPARTLFEQRALAAHPEWALTEATAPVVNEICRRLDGLPLALELAAARSQQFGPRELLARLQPGLSEFSDGPRDLDSRQRTLRAAMDWSYGLLDRHEQTLFRRLAPFAGGAAGDAVASVCNADGAVGADIEPILLALARRNLVAIEGGGRFSLLETVRAFARLKLDEAGETSGVCAAHFAHYAGLAEESEAKLLTAERQSWLSRLEAEQHNMRAALDWSFAQDDAAGALRLATALGTWWEVRSQASTGRVMTERALDRAGSIAPALRAKAWFWLGRIGLRQGALRQARFELGRGLELYRTVGDERGMANVLNDLGSVAHWMGDFHEAERRLRESLELRERLSDGWGIAQATNNLGMLCVRRGDYDAARAHFERCLERWQAIGAEMPLAWPLGGLGQVALAQGDLGAGLHLIERSVEIWRKHPFPWALALRLNDLGLAHLLRGSLDAARAAHEESMALSRLAGDRRGEAFAIEGLARVASAEGQPERATELFNLADARLAETGSALGALERGLRG